jgi:glutathione peroxidase
MNRPDGVGVGANTPVCATALLLPSVAVRSDVDHRQVVGCRGDRRAGEWKVAVPVVTPDAGVSSGVQSSTLCSVTASVPRFGSCPSMTLITTRRGAFAVAAASCIGAALRPGATVAQPSTACPALLQQSFARLQDEKPQELCQYAGKVLLVVNTASYCGYTPQYEGLEALHAKYAPRGLVVMGFPSNDFGQQEPGGSKQIAELCFNTYGVRFPMFAKSAVVGAGANPLYAQLAAATGESPRWNFHKYLVDRRGRAVGSFASKVKPDDRTLVAAIEQALAQR